MGSKVTKPRARRRGVAPRDSAVTAGTIERNRAALVAPAPKEPPQVWVDGEAGAEAAYVRLPVSAEVVAAVREHADNAAALYAMVKQGERVPVAELLSLLSKAAAAVERDAAKIRRR